MLRVRRIFRADPRIWAGFFVAVALLVRLPLFINGFGSSVAPDSGFYLNVANSLLAGEGFETEGVRTPGYPIFVALLQVLPGPRVETIVIVQHVLGALLAGAVFLVSDRYFGRLPAFLAAAAMALTPMLMAVEHKVLPDWLLAVALLAGAVALIEAVPFEPREEGARTGIRWGVLAIAGLLFGVATMIKPGGLALIVVAPLFLAFATRSWRLTWRGTALTTGAMLAIVLPWMVHNEIKDDHFQLSNQGGVALWYRVFDQDRAPIPTDSEDGRLANELYARYLEGPKNPAFTDPQLLGPETPTESYSYVYNHLIYRLGLDRYEAADFQGDLAIQAIRADPVLYGKGTVRNVWDYATYNSRPFGFESAKVEGNTHLYETSDPVPEELATIPWDVSKALLQAGFFLTLAFAAVPLLLFFGERRARLAAASLILVWVAIAAAGSLTAAVVSRYAAEVAPLQWILMAATVVLLGSAAVRLMDRR